jgi:hypothetical protein
MSNALNPHYVLAELARALETAVVHADPAVRERARARLSKWSAVAQGLASGTLDIGSRQPTSAPVWATLEVLHGGCASGVLAAEGERLAHERELAARLGVDATDRRAFALHYLSAEGRTELLAMLESGMYAIDVPEEGALLAMAAVLAHGEADAAMRILEAIGPYLSRLRFFPRPTRRRSERRVTVHVTTVGPTRQALASVETPVAVRRMHETLAVWIPLTDRAVDLVVETIVAERPFARVSAEWGGRAARFLSDYASARARHTLVRRPHKAGENLSVLASAIETAAAGLPLSSRELGLVRVAVRGHEAAHGKAGSDARAARRAEESRVLGIPTRKDVCADVVRRLEAQNADGTLTSIEDVPRYASVRKKLERCLEASVGELVSRGALTSGEAVARVLPQVSAHVRSLGFADPRVALLHAQIDAAFRRRRSLLLLGYERQVSLDELPWVSALEALRRDDGTSTSAARSLLAEVAAVVIDAFPHAIVPNPLLKELRALADRAQLRLPLVDELAADIFQGGFTSKFVEAARIAADRLEGTLYARYFELPVAEVRAVAASAAGGPAGPIAAFGDLCRSRAPRPAERRSRVAECGQVIEQQQILTTQNLVPLLDLSGLPRGRCADLALRTFGWIRRRYRRELAAGRPSLSFLKNGAYAFRQLIVYLSYAGDEAAADFLRAAEAAVARDGVAGVRLRNVLDGLVDAHEGRTPRVRYLGWVTGDHPLLPRRAGGT